MPRLRQKDTLRRRKYVEFYEFADIPHTSVVERALKPILPFRENEKGYRDTLIWLSLINHLKTKTRYDELVFISNNSSDFYAKNELRFHDHLQKDIQDNKIQCQIRLYRKLNDFIKTEIEGVDTEFTAEYLEEHVIDEHETDIESEVEWQIVHMSTSDIKTLLINSETTPRYISPLLNHDFEIFEGIEDGEILNFKRFSTDSLYLTYRFNLRKCTFVFMVPEDYYLEHKNSISVYYNDVIVMDSEAHFMYYCRPELTINFIYHFDSGAITGLEIQSIKFL